MGSLQLTTLYRTIFLLSTKEMVFAYFFSNHLFANGIINGRLLFTIALDLFRDGLESSAILPTSDVFG